MKQRLLLKTIAIALVATSTVVGSNLGSIKANAATNEKVKSFTVKAGDGFVNVNVDKIDEENVRVTSVTNEGETHEVTYNRNDDYMIMDGEKVPVKITQEIDKSKLKNVFSTQAADPYTPVYMATNKVTFADMVGTLGAVVTLVSAAITFGVFAFTTAALETSVQKALAAIGVGTLFGSTYLSGYIKYDQYRTTGQFSNAAGSQYMYRTQNYIFGGKFGEKSLPSTKISGGPSSWYFSSKPY